MLLMQEDIFLHDFIKPLPNLLYQKDQSLNFFLQFFLFLLCPTSSILIFKQNSILLLQMHKLFQKNFQLLIHSIALSRKELKFMIQMELIKLFLLNLLKAMKLLSQKVDKPLQCSFSFLRCFVGIQLKH